MPEGLFATLGLNASQWGSGWTAAAKAAVKGEAEITAAVHAGANSQALFLEQQLVIARKLAAANSAGATEQVVLLEAELAVARASTVTTGVKAMEAAAKLEDATATEIDVIANKKLNAILGQGVRIGRELARGQTERAVERASRLLQMIGIPLKALIPIALAVGAAVYLCYKGFHGLVEEAEKVGKSVALLNARIEAHINTIRKVGDESRRFREELEEINRIGRDPSMTKATEDRVAAMHKQFEIAQRMAKLSGQTPQASARAQQEEAKKEAAVYEEAAKKAKEKSDASKAAAAALDTPAKQAELQKARENLEVAHTNAEGAKKNLQEMEEAMRHVGGSGLVPQWMAGEGLHPITSIGNTLRSALGKPITSPLGTIDPSIAKQDSAVAELALAKSKDTVEAKENARKVALEVARKDAQDTAALEEKAKAAKESAEAEGEDGTDVEKKKSGGSHEKMMLTEYQRIGAFVGPSAGTDMLTVTKGMAAHVAGIHHALSSQHAHDGAGAPGGF